MDPNNPQPQVSDAPVVPPTPVMPPTAPQAVQTPPVPMSPEPKKTSPLVTIAIALVVVAVIAVAAYFIGAKFFAPGTSQKACTMEAKICPDGSSVGRTEPDCEFAPCPTSTPDPTAGWGTYTNQQFAYEMKYPNNWKVDREETDTAVFKSLVQFSQTNPKTLNNFVVMVEKKTYDTLYNELKDNSSRYKGSVTEYKLNSLISAQKATMITGAGDSDYVIDIIFEKNNVIIHIQASFINPPDIAETNQFGQILSSFKFLDQVSPTSPSAKTITYKLPAGWQTITDKDGLFSVGYNPETHSASSLNSRVDLNSKSCCSSFFLRLLPYNGGSRHIFIYNGLNTSETIKTSSTLEQEYLINGKSSLFLYNVDMSGSNTVGMIAVTSSKALLVESQAGSRELVEQVLGSLKFTN